MHGHWYSQKLVFYNLGSELATILSSIASRFTTFFHFYFYLLHSFSFFQTEPCLKDRKILRWKNIYQQTLFKEEVKSWVSDKENFSEKFKHFTFYPQNFYFTAVHFHSWKRSLMLNFVQFWYHDLNQNQLKKKQKPLSSVTDEHGDSQLVDKTTEKYKQFEWIWRQAHLISFWLKCQWIILVFLTCVRSLLKYKLELEMSLQVHCMKHQHVLYM